MGSDVYSPRDMAQSYEAGRASAMHTPNPHPHQLTITEIERLAKAGVTVDMEKVSIQPEGYKPYFKEQQVLMDPLIHRMRITFPINNFDHTPRFQHMSAFPIGGNATDGRLSPTGATKVGLMVVTAHGNAALLEDDYNAWPSDALFAKIHLLLETEDKHTRPPPLLPEGDANAPNVRGAQMQGLRQVAQQWIGNPLK